MKQALLKQMQNAYDEGRRRLECVPSSEFVWRLWVWADENWKWQVAALIRDGVGMGEKYSFLCQIIEPGSFDTHGWSHQHDVKREGLRLRLENLASAIARVEAIEVSCCRAA
jgi:hypothetical protein